jgi:hypothetical protein
MKSAAFLLGDPGRMPFIGHFQVGIHTGGASLAVAGRVAAHSGVVRGFRAARELESALLGMSTVEVQDRHDLIRRAWTVLHDVEACDFGPDGGADLTLLMVAQDAQGMGIAGVGLSGVWGWSGAVGDEVLPLVQGAHPLLGDPGMPGQTPGVLTLDAPVARVVAVPSHLQPVLPGPDTLARRCGVHP